MRVLIIIFFSLAVFGCSTVNQETATKRTIHYEKKTFLLESVKGCQEDQMCARYEVSYPVFSGLAQSVVDSLQREIELSLSMGDPEAEDKTMAVVAQQFIDGFTEFQKEMPDAGMGWYYKADVIVNIASDTLLSLEIKDEYFTGGAHGGGGTHFININPSSGKMATLDSELKSGYVKKLTEAGEDAFRKARELADTATYRFNDFEFENDQFQLSSNYGFTNEGIVFVFNSYEIAPYAIGPTDFVVPYSEIKDWLK